LKLRKLFSIMFIFIVVSAYTPESNVFAEDSSSIDPLSPMEIRLTVGKLQYTKNGVQDLFDVAPFIDSVNARTMVPIRFIAQAMGAKIEWIDAEKTDYITVWGKTLKIVLNQPLPNGMGAAVIKDDRLFVPVRYVSEQLGATVGWDKAERSVVITFMAKLNGVSYSKYNPIVAGSFLLGGFDGKKWIDQGQ